jgi:bla regulator protein BlaR1
MVLNDALLQAISWTLIHSVWQGFILALLAGLFIEFTRKSRPALRYNILAVLFVGFLVVAGLTFNYEFQDENFEAITRLNLPILAGNAMAGTNAEAPINISILIIDFLNRNANVIALLWFVVFSVKCFGVFRSFGEVYRIRKYKTRAVSEYWSEKVAGLGKQIGLKKTIVLLESGLVKVPSVTGFFKPMILIPVGLLSNLPQEQIEAILLHELAHIRRKDYGMNLIQRLAETVFFFNPGLLWVSALLKDERENCCDDIAIGVTQNKTKFITALVSFEEYQLNGNALAMGFGSKKAHLLHRAKRIIYNNNKSLDAIEKTFLSVGLVVIAVITLACSKMTDKSISDGKPAMSNRQIERQIAKKDSIKQAKADAIARAADLQAKIADAEAIIEDKKVAAEDARVAAETARIQAQIKANEAKPVAAPEPTSKVTRTVTSKTRTDNTSETTYHQEESNGKTVSLRTGISGDDLPEDINSNDFTNKLTNDLISEKIISSTKNLSYKLSRKSLIVNGVLQPQSTFRKLKDKYLSNQFHVICYNYEISDIADIRN